LLFTIAIVLGVVCIIYVLYGKPWHGDSMSPLQNGLDLDTASDEEQVGEYAEPIKSPADPNSYRVFNLSIGLEVMIISDPKTHLSAAAIDFGVGDFQDFFEDENGKKIGTHGLAHFHEHMVYLGTKDYPGRDAFDKELTKYHGGADADTADQNTNFRIWVQNDGLEMALKMWASHFTNPLFEQDKIDMEMHQVHAEYLLDKPQEGERQFEMVKLSARKGHPYNSFDVGALKTLNIPGIRDMLVKFHNKYFSARIAKLCVYTSLSLDKGQELVKKTFSGILHQKIKYPEVPGDAFGPDQVKKNYVVESSNYKDTLSISWPLPSDTYYHMRVPAIDWITNQIEYKGPGGLYDVLLRKGLASWISTEETCRDRSVEVFSMIVNLTPKGLWRTPTVAGYILDYVKMLLNDGLVDWRFEEYRDLDQTAWNYFRRPDDLGKYVRNIAEQMHFNEPEDMLYPNFRSPPERYVFNLKFLKRVLGAMTGDNMISYLFTKHKNFTRYRDIMENEPWFDISYMVDTIKESYLKKWRESKESSDLSLPPKNTWKMTHSEETTLTFDKGPCGIKYMPKSGKVTAIKEDGQAQKLGVSAGWRIKKIAKEDFSQETMNKYNDKERKIVFSHPVLPYEEPDDYEDNSPQFWYGEMESALEGYFSYDTRKKMPRVWISIRLKNPNLRTNARNMALSKLFQKVTMYQFNLGYGQARDGGYHISVSVHRSAIEYQFHGYHLHMGRLVWDFVDDCFNKTISNKAFHALRVNLRDSIRNDMMGVAHFQGWNWFLHAVGAKIVPMRDQAAELAIINQKDYEKFVDYVSENVEALFFVFGNADDAFVQDIGQAVENAVSPRHVTAINETNTSHRMLPTGVSVLQTTNENPHDDNHCVTILWQIPLGQSDHEYYWTVTLLEMLVNIFKQKAFDELRTKQNLGYTCQTRLENFGFVLYLRLDVEGPDHDATQILDAILKFVDDFWRSKVKKIDDDRWSKMKKTQSGRYKKRDVTLQETNDEFWIDLKSGSSAFDNQSKMSDMADRVLLSEFRDFYQQRIRSNERRAIAIQVFRQGAKHTKPSSKHKLLDQNSLLKDQDWVESAELETSVADRRVWRRPHSPFDLSEIY